MPNFIISESFQITNRGTAAALVGDPPPSLAIGKYLVLLTRPDGCNFKTTASVEFARKVPPGEVMMFLFSHNELSEITPGSHITVLGVENDKN